jgi:hypothetical protein
VNSDPAARAAGIGASFLAAGLRPARLRRIRPDRSGLSPIDPKKPPGCHVSFKYRSA